MLTSCPGGGEIIADIASFITFLLLLLKCYRTSPYGASVVSLWIISVIYIWSLHLCIIMDISINFMRHFFGHPGGGQKPFTVQIDTFR